MPVGSSSESEMATGSILSLLFPLPLHQAHVRTEARLSKAVSSYFNSPESHDLPAARLWPWLHSQVESCLLSLASPPPSPKDCVSEVLGSLAS